MNVKELVESERLDAQRDVEVAQQRAMFVDEVGALAQSLLDLLGEKEPNSMQLSVSGYASEPHRIYANVSLYFKQQQRMEHSAAVLEALDEVLPLEKWTNSDDAQSVTRIFEQDYRRDPEERNHEINVRIFWAVAEGIESGCFKRLVRVERHHHDREENIYEIVCQEAPQ